MKLPGKRTGLLLLPLLFWLLPTVWLERGPSLCLITYITGKPCPGCGMTRALSCLVHDEPRRAWRYNRLAFIVAPLLGYVWAKSLLTTSHSVPSTSLEGEKGSHELRLSTPER
ncbi:MAG TPA: DUF2752 domain-containing protein [Ktedonobacteraceae bacterium]